MINEKIKYKKNTSKVNIGHGEESKKINAEFDFWINATTFIKTIVHENAEELIHEHVTKMNFNDNEKRLFREYLTKAFDMYPMMSYLKHYDDKNNK
jgi:hypothetical protein